jgi:hypothetical protein
VNNAGIGGVKMGSDDGGVSILWMIFVFEAKYRWVKLDQMCLWQFILTFR